ncbi:MAG: type II secretion system F family protein [Acidobacteriota bacterium]
MLIPILIFVAIFAILAPILIWWTGAAKTDAKEAVAALDTAIGKAEVDTSAVVINFRKNELVSAIPWLNKRLEQLELIPRIRRMLMQAEIKWTPGQLILMSAVAFAIPAYLIHLRTSSLGLSLLIGAAIGFGPTGYVLFKRSKRFGKFERGLPEALDLMVSALRVGHSFNSALGLVTRECPDPVGPEFRIAFDEQNFGLDLRTALENLLVRVPLQDLRMSVTAILIQRESGGNLAEVLEKTAWVIRQRFRLKKQVSVHTAQGRLTGWILTILPIGLGIALYLINPKTESLLWTKPIGIKLLWGAAGMLTIGTVIIQKIVRMEV